jgi:hypothetical protein
LHAFGALCPQQRTADRSFPYAIPLGSKGGDRGPDITKTLARKPKAATHWSVRAIAKETGMSRGRRHGEAEHAGCLMVDVQLDLGRLRDRQIGRLGT